MIEDVAFGRIVVNGRTYTRDVVIYPDRVDDTWWRREGHRLHAEDLAAALAAAPEVLVVGTGMHGLLRIPDAVRRHLTERGVDLRAARTPEACAVYNEIAPHKRTIAALHLTC